MVISGNTFNGASSHNIWAYADSDVDNLDLNNNVMSCSTCTHVYFWDDSSFAPSITDNTFTGGDVGVHTISTEIVTINNNVFNNQEDYAMLADGGDFSGPGQRWRLALLLEPLLASQPCTRLRSLGRQLRA